MDCKTVNIIYAFFVLKLDFIVILFQALANAKSNIKQDLNTLVIIIILSVMFN
jgi:hypothetical protein